MPATWLLYCTLGTKPLDVVRNGATPGGAPLSSVVMTVRAHPEEMSDAKAALTEAIRRQKLGEQRVVVWFRAGGTATASGAGRGTLPGQLADPQVQALIGEFMKLGGGVILQENVFRDSVASRVLLKSDLCPVGEPYQAMNAPGGDWLVSDPQAPALSRFAALPLEGKAPFGIPAVSQPPRVRVGVKPWAMVAARNAQGDPAVVASTDPQRPIAYLGGAIEGTYMAERYGVHDYPEQMTQLLYFYAELARWLSVFGRH